ncbi:MAG: hypothetical protein OXH69_11360 [Acidobacteria bacterium]|nr:hypothetical protein [Acidobacteriota bacterium]
MRPRWGAVALCAFAAAVALTWSGCSEETASPVAPTPAPAAGTPAGGNSGAPASPGGPAANGVQPRITVQLDGGFSPSGTAPAGVDGGGSPTTTSLVIDTGAVFPPATGPGRSLPSMRPTAGPAVGGAPEVPAAAALKESSRESSVDQVDHDSEAAGGEGSDLKASAPTPTSPAGGVEIPDVRPVLQVTNAEPDEAFLAAFAEENFHYQFEIYNVVGGSRTAVEAAATVPGGSGSTSYRVATSLARAASYTWRARAVFDGAYGPWSEDAAFSTAAVVLSPPEPRSPIAGASVDVDTAFNVGNPTVEGRIRGGVGGIQIEIQVATDDMFASIVGTDCEHARGRGDTNLALNVFLADETTHYWRARAMATAVSGGNRVTSAWSEVASFRTRAVRLATPRPLAPIDGATVGVGTHFRVRNGAVRGISSRGVQIEVQVATSRTFDDPRTGSTRMRGGAETTVDLRGNLMPSQQYFWQARATVSAGGAGEFSSEWSDAASFRTSADGGGGGTVPTGPAGPFGPGGNPPNLLSLLQQLAAQHPDALRNSCQDHGGSWRFMEFAVERLRQESGRWGYNCKRGNCPDVSHDAIAYYRGSGQTIDAAQNSTNVAIIDIIAGHCGPNPQPSWLDVTQATADANSIGRWRYPR